MQSVEYVGAQADRPRWRENIPFWSVHVAALIGAVMVGWSWTAFWWLAGTYAVRMFAITAGYHRYFSHRTFKTSRVFQFILAVLGMTTAQQGPLWWAAHHRRHHKYSDTPEDIHSPRQRGFVWSHMQWILAKRHKATDYERIKDFAKYPELRFMNNHDLAFVIGTAVVTFVVGGTTGLVWGFFVSIVCCWHITFCINSLAHVLGKKRYATEDDSRNNLTLALLTFGEGWHNNHHHYQRSARQGFYWWEVDISFYGLKLLQALRIVWDVEGVPRHVRDQTEAPERERVRAGGSASSVPAGPGLWSSLHRGAAPGARRLRILDLRAERRARVDGEAHVVARVQADAADRAAATATVAGILLAGRAVEHRRRAAVAADAA